MRFTGVVTKGVGEGAMYVDAYNHIFERHLGTKFHPGTLNLTTKDVVKLERGIAIPSPKPGMHEVHCYPVVINDAVKGFIVIPMARRHPDSVIELLAPMNLKEHFNLKEGDEVTCELA